MKSRIQGDRIATQRWLRARIRLYAEHAGLPKTEYPKVEFGPIPGDAHFSAGPQAYCDYATNTIRVDLSKTLCRHDGDDTAAHEIVHARWPSLPHSSLFARRVLALREGHRCGAKGAALPEVFR